MIDLHCHILSGIDDGPADPQTSLVMARMAAKDGITRLVASPHYRYGTSPSAEDIRLRVSRFNEELRREGISLEILPGADIHLTFELLKGFDTGDLPTINNTRYFLLELPLLMPPNIEQFIFRARTKGLVPIITHPERNYTLLTSREKLMDLREAGVLFQITAMSITGEFGEQVQSYSEMMLKKACVDFVATDAHDPVHRVPVLSAAYRDVCDILDKQQAETIFHKNPEAVIADVEIT
jgi:protein-tyrosine phosphatase